MKRLNVSSDAGTGNKKAKFDQFESLLQLKLEEKLKDPKFRELSEYYLKYIQFLSKNKVNAFIYVPTIDNLEKSTDFSLNVFNILKTTYVNYLNMPE